MYFSDTDEDLDFYDVELIVGELADDIEYRYGDDTAERLRELWEFCAYKIPHTMSPQQILDEARATHARITTR